MGNEAPGLIGELPGRYRPGLLSGTLRVRLDVGDESHDVVLEPDSCRIEVADGLPLRSRIQTDAVTWARIHAGELSGVEAFAQRRLVVGGSIEWSLRFETLFTRPRAGGLEYEMGTVRLPRADVSYLAAGDVDAPVLLMLHGLGATKASWLTVVPELARRYRVVALDLPGFGASSKPPGRYDAPWFAHYAFAAMDALGIDRCMAAGNSMGGRIATEMAILDPGRVEAIACLCGAAAFARRPFLWLARLSRPELGLVVRGLPRDPVKRGLKQLFASPESVPEPWYDAAVDEFLEQWRDPRARRAFLAAARRIYLDEPWGHDGFWARLALIGVPALFVYGKHDVLITARFGTAVERVLPSAQVLVWEDCGHVPQIEHPRRTEQTLTGFFG